MSTSSTSALSQRSQALHNLVRRLKRDCQGEPSQSALYEMAEVDLLCATLMGQPEKLDQYLRALALRATYSQRLRITPALFRPSTSIPDDDDPYVREHLRKIGVLSDDG